MKITVPARDADVLRKAVRGYFGLSDECDDMPTATVTQDREQLTILADESALGFDQHIRGLYANIQAAFPKVAWEASFPELLI